MRGRSVRWLAAPWSAGVGPMAVGRVPPPSNRSSSINKEAPRCYWITPTQLNGARSTSASVFFSLDFVGLFVCWFFFSNCPFFFPHSASPRDEFGRIRHTHARTPKCFVFFLAIVSRFSCSLSQGRISYLSERLPNVGPWPPGRGSRPQRRFPWKRVALAAQCMGSQCGVVTHFGGSRPQRRFHWKTVDLATP